MARLKTINKNKIRSKAAKLAAQKYADDKAKVRAEKAAAKDTYKEGIGAAKGLKHLIRGSKKTALAELGDTGLKGLAKQQMIDSLKQQLASTENIVPVERATLKPELKDTLAAANDQMFTIANAEAANAEARYNTLLSRKRTTTKNYNERIRTRRGRAKEAARTAKTKETDFNKEVNAALAEIRDATYTAAVKDSPEGVAPERKAALKAEATALAEDPQRLKALVDHLAGAAGSRKAAKVAARKFVRRYNDPTILDDLSPFD